MSNVFSNAVQNLGGLFAGSPITTTAVPYQQQGISISSGTPINISGNIIGGPYQFAPQQLFKKVFHTPKTADAFQNLTAYLRSVTACEEHCECKWCAASELERKMAIVLFLKPEAEEEE